jgi:hypothetical protein
VILADKRRYQRIYFYPFVNRGRNAQIFPSNAGAEEHRGKSAEGAVSDGDGHGDNENDNDNDNDNGGQALEETGGAATDDLEDPHTPEGWEKLQEKLVAQGKRPPIDRS